MVNLLKLPYTNLYNFKSTDLKNLIFGKELISKGLAEDIGCEIQYESEKSTIKYFIKLLIKSLYLGTGNEIIEIMENLNVQETNFVNEIIIFVIKLWENSSFYQKSILFYMLLNEYSYKDIAYILQASPSYIKKQVQKLAELMDSNIKYERLHEIILTANNEDKGIYESL